MNEHDELLDGENVDPRDEDALREALYDQLCMDAALTAHFGGASADERVRQSVMASLQASDEPQLQRQVMRDARLQRPRRAPQRWLTGLSLAAAAAVVFMGLGWWLMREQPQPSQLVKQVPEPQVMPVIEKPTPVVPAPQPVEKAVVQTPAPRMETPPSVTPTREPPKAAPIPLPPVVVAATPPVMRDNTTTTANASPITAAKPAAEMKPSLGTPPPAAVVPPMPRSDRRDPALWPFSASSPWNMPIGSEAKLEAIVPTEFAAQIIGFQPRTIFIATAQHPIVRFKRSRGATMKLPFAREWADAVSMRAAPVTIIEPDGQWAVEYHGLRRDGDDWSAADITRISLLEDGVGRDARGVGELGLPALAGVIRSGEWQGGIHHVIGISVPASLLNAKAGGGKAYVWPVQPEQVPDTSSFAKRGNLHLGSLLALPLEAHPVKLGLAEGTPHYQLALALWNHGACIIGSTREGNGGISLLTETLAGGSMDRDALTRVFAQLRVVTNHSATRPGGGGKPRFVLAPAFAPAK
ncbi:MAG: hypothetical protein ACKVY0_25540 [Prosthecobacter sp.]|uniref:hypothetical protein n=1 Tax=Prosthecobacter sp. TaxID=1965333 RepID=UPI003902758A